MTIFWIIAAALAFMAPLFVAWPLLKSHTEPRDFASTRGLKLSVYRDQLAELGEERRTGTLAEDQYAQARDDLEKRLLEEVPEAGTSIAASPPRTYRAVAFAAVVAVPLFAVFLYLALGNPAVLRPQPSEIAHGLGQQQMDALIARLAARLEKNPEDAKGWVMLARAQAVLGRFDEASLAYARSVQIFPDDAQLLADYADALAMARGRRLTGEPEQLVERALRADPNNAKALALAGTIAFDNRDFKRAIKHWERLRSSIPPGSEFGKSIQGSIDEAKNLAAGASAPRASSAAAVSQTSARRRSPVASAIR